MTYTSLFLSLSLFFVRLRLSTWNMKSDCVSLKVLAVMISVLSVLICLPISYSTPHEAIQLPLVELAEAYTSAYHRLTAKASSQECKNKILSVFHDYWRAFLLEDAMPLERSQFYSQCPILEQNSFPAYKFEGESEYEVPSGVDIPRREEETIDHSTLGIMYVMLVHQDPEFVCDIIEALNEPMHTFVVHVDLKSPHTYSYLSSQYSTNSTTSFQNVYILEGDSRVETNWGAFSIVQATLNCLEFGLQLNRSFDYAIDLSGTTYPIKSNNRIRKFLSRNVNVIYNAYSPDPVVPTPELLFAYVECDGFVHRISRLAQPRGMSVYVGSQWFAAPRHVIEWLLSDPLPLKYKDYAQYVVVADEQYFATMFLNSPYCEDMMNKDLNYLIFTDWTVELGNIHKCLQPDPLRCGRSPTTLTLDMQPAIEMTNALFARKFNPHNQNSTSLLNSIKASLEVDKDIDDDTHHQQSNILDKNNAISEPYRYDLTDETKGSDNGKPFLIRLAYESAAIAEVNRSGKFPLLPKCLAFPSSPGELMKVRQCSETDPHQNFVKSNCVHINSSHFHEFGENVTPENKLNKPQHEIQEYCRLRGIINGLMERDEYFCVDIAGMTPVPHSDIIAYPCQGSWNQYFKTNWSKGSVSSIASTIPSIVREVTGMNDYPGTLCLQAHVSSSSHNEVEIDETGQYVAEYLEAEVNYDQPHSHGSLISLKSNSCENFEVDLTLKQNQGDDLDGDGQYIGNPEIEHSGNNIEAPGVIEIQGFQCISIS